jgi:hypothetical protein
MWVDSAVDGVISVNLQVGNIGGTWFPTPVTFCGDAPASPHVVTYVFGTGAQPNPGVTVASLSGNPNLRVYGSGDTITGFVTFPGNGGCTNTCMATNMVSSFAVQNNTSSAQLYWLMLDGVPQCGTFSSGSGTGQGMLLAPGQSGTLTTPPYAMGCNTANDGNYTLQPYNPLGLWSICPGGSYPGDGKTGSASPPTSITSTGGGSLGGTGGTITTGGTGSTGTGSPGTTYAPTNSNPIVFDPTNSPGGTNGATDGTLQEGLGAIYDAINRNGANASVAAQALLTEEKSHGVLFQAMTNYSGQSLLSLQSGFANSTNLLAQATNWLTALFRVASNSLTMQTNGFNGVSNAVQLANQAQTNAAFANIASNRVNTAVLSNMFYGMSNAWMVGNTNMTNGLVLLGASISNSFAAVLGGLTNLGGGGTNAFSDGGITNAIGSQHRDITNLLAAQLDYSGSNAGVGGSNVVAGWMVPGTATNSGEALVAGTAASADVVSGVDSAVSAIGVAPVVSESASFPVLSLAIAGRTMNFSPDALAPGVTGFVKAAITMMLLIVFAQSCGKLMWEASRAYAQAQTGGVPDLDAEVLGFGGNVPGLIVAIAVPVIFIGLWVAVFTGLFALFTSTMTGLATASFSPPSATALAMLTAVFPVNLALSLAWTRIGLQFTATKLVVIAASASRYLFGK